MRSRTGLVALTIMLLAATAACGPGSTGRSSSPAAPPLDHHVMRLAAATAAPISPKQVRAGFEQLLGLHALLAVRQMRSVVAAAPAFGQVAGVSLQTNTDELTRLVGTATDPLTKAITAHDQHLIDQVDACAAKDYPRVQQMERDGYGQMLGVANMLMDAIQRTVNRAKRIIRLGRSTPRGA